MTVQVRHLCSSKVFHQWFLLFSAVCHMQTKTPLRVRVNIPIIIKYITKTYRFSEWQQDLSSEDVKVIGWSWAIHHNPVAFVQLGYFKLLTELLRETLKASEKCLKDQKKRLESHPSISDSQQLPSSRNLNQQISAEIMLLAKGCIPTSHSLLFLILPKNVCK